MSSIFITPKEEVMHLVVITGTQAQYKEHSHNFAFILKKRDKSNISWNKVYQDKYHNNNKETMTKILHVFLFICVCSMFNYAAEFKLP